MKLTEKEIILLDRCRDLGDIGSEDIDIAFNFSAPTNYYELYRLGNIKKRIMERLEKGGYLTRIGSLGSYRWKLTEKGIEALKKDKNMGKKERELKLRR